MKVRTIVLLGLAAFLLTLVIVMPARWVALALPARVQCDAWAGSIWQGQCQQLSISDNGRSTLRLTSLRWKLHPAALLRLSLSAEFQGAWAQGSAAGRVLVRPGGQVQLRDVQGQSGLDQSFLGSLPAGWNGRLELRQVELDWDAGQVGRLGGELIVSDLADARGSALGSYQAQFASSTTPPFTGELRDTGGPVELQAQLTLSADRSWSLDGRMRARNTGDAALARRLDVLSPADASGWRRVSAAGYFR